MLRPRAFLKHSRHRSLDDLLSSSRRLAIVCSRVLLPIPSSLCTVTVILPMSPSHKHVRRVPAGPENKNQNCLGTLTGLPE